MFITLCKSPSTMDPSPRLADLVPRRGGPGLGGLGSGTPVFSSHSSFFSIQYLLYSSYYSIVFSSPSLSSTILFSPVLSSPPGALPERARWRPEPSSLKLGLPTGHPTLQLHFKCFPSNSVKFTSKKSSLSTQSFCL